MDPTRFDRLAKSLSAATTRRRMVRLLTALPVVSSLAALFADPAAADKDRDDRRQRRRKRKKGKGKNNGSGSVCAGKANDTPCGPGGDDGHCCQGGVCSPPLDCLSVNEPCGTPEECAQTCCTERGAACSSALDDCICDARGPGGPCGSNGDCVDPAICFCGTCCCGDGCDSGGGQCGLGCIVCPFLVSG